VTFLGYLVICSAKDLYVMLQIRNEHPGTACLEGIHDRLLPQCHVVAP